MKMNRFAGLALAGICTLFATDALANDSVAVMKLDAIGENVEAQTTMVLEALRKEVMNSDVKLDANGGDITYTEMLMVTGCEDATSIACYDTACTSLGTPAIIFGSVGDGGETHVVWYVSGKGIFREKKGVVTDQASAEKLAKDLVVGEMGSLIVTSNVPGADVFVDGKRLGMSSDSEETATPIQLVAGNYIVAVRMDGYEKEDAVKVTIDGNGVAKMHVDMVEAVDPEERAALARNIGYGLLGGGAAVAIVGSVFAGLIAPCKYTGDDGFRCGSGSWWEKNHVADAIKTAANNPKKEEAQEAQEALKDANSSGTAANITAWTLLGVGTAAIVGGVISIVIGSDVTNFMPDEVEASAMPKINFNVTPEYQGMTLGWKF